MVLIIACANLGTMMLARGIARRRETAIRLAVGAGGRDIVREVLCECGIIGAAGVASGMLLTWWALYIMPHFAILPIAELGDMLPVPSWRVFCFALAITLARSCSPARYPRCARRRRIPPSR
jgi:ABC-type antimicrobial peptide transport system permease subunit